MGGKPGDRKTNKDFSSGLIYRIDEKQFWEAYKRRKGYILTRDSTYTEKTFEDMMLFMCDVLPLTYNEIKKFPYRRFFRTLKIAQKEAKRREDEANRMKNKSSRKK